MARKHDDSMMNNLYWWGIPTMFRCPHENVDGADIALVGVPHSTGNGTTERDQHLGPRAIRNVSALQRRVHGEFRIDPGKPPGLLMLVMFPFPGRMIMNIVLNRLRPSIKILITQEQGQYQSAVIILSPVALFKHWVKVNLPKGTGMFSAS